MSANYKNLLLEKIKESSNITDKILAKKLVSDGHIISEGFFNQLLLDLEIMGLITVSWITKDTRRIEIVSSQEEKDDVENFNKKTIEKDYESSFPKTENDTT
jgi:hypothetical protein|tara:strand:- start:194 stop:499 length:306 start_codon:yes stop_codon:yes gene_type:complete